MPEVIKLRKGLDIKLKGSANKELVAVKASQQYALVPDDFVGITPKVVVTEGQQVKAGEALFVDKNHQELFPILEKVLKRIKLYHLER